MLQAIGGVFLAVLLLVPPEADPLLPTFAGYHAPPPPAGCTPLPGAIQCLPSSAGGAR